MAQPNQFCQIPPQNVPFLNADGTVATVWYKFLHDLHIVSGANTPGHGLTRWSPITGIPDAMNNAQFGYVKENPGIGLLPTLYVFDQTTGAGSATGPTYPVGFIDINPLP